MRRLMRLSLLYAVALLAAALVSCAGPGQNPDENNAPEGTGGNPVNLVYYTIGTPDQDLALVNNKLNELLVDKIGITVEYRKINWDEYEGQIAVLIDSGRPFDIAYAQNYAQDAQKGAWLCLDDYLTSSGCAMYDAIDPTFWEGVTIDGHIYGVPTNKELAVLEQWMFPEELVEKYQIDIESYKTLESLEPLFEMIQRNEPHYLVMELDKNSHNFFALDGYEYILDKTVPLAVKSLDDHPTIVNPFETSEGWQILDTLRRYYLAGYINEDAAVKPASDLERDKKVFFTIASGGPYADIIWSQQRGYRVLATMVSDPIVTTESTRAGVMSVNAATRHPEESVAFLNCINTDPEVRNLLNYGIEGVHYTLNDQGQVLLNEDLRYTGVQYTQGNWFILKTRGSPTPEPLDKWDVYKAFNASAIKSKILGFTPDLSGHTAQIEAIHAVWQKYYPPLMTGSVDVDTFLPAYLGELKEAGLDDVKAELQTQLDQWLISK